MTSADDSVEVRPRVRFVRDALLTVVGALVVASVLTLIVWLFTGRSEGAWTWLGFLATWWALVFSALIAVWVRETYLTSGRLETVTARIADTSAEARESARRAEAAAADTGSAVDTIRGAVDRIEVDTQAARTSAEAAHGTIQDVAETLRAAPSGGDRPSHDPQPSQLGTSPWIPRSLDDAPEPVLSQVAIFFGGRGLPRDLRVYEDPDRRRWLILLSDDPYLPLLILENGRSVAARYLEMEFASPTDLLFLL